MVNLASEEFNEFNKIDEVNLIKVNEDKLRAYLESVNFYEVKFIQIFKYIGKDKSSDKEISAIQLYNGKFATLTWSTKKIKINMVVQKLP